MKDNKTLTQKIKELEEKIDWFYSDDFELEEATTNYKTAIALAKEFKEKFPSKTIWLYTGFCWNEIIDDDSMKDIIKHVDVICDGPFVESLKDPSLQWVGSSNQHVIDVKERIKKINDIAKTIS